MSERGGGVPGNPPRIPGIPSNAHFHELAEFRTLNVQRPRPSIQDQEMAWCQNLMPIGAYYLRALPDHGESIFGTPLGPPEAVRFLGSSVPQLAIDGTAIGVITSMGAQNLSGSSGTFGPLTTTAKHDLLVLFVSTETAVTKGSFGAVQSITGGGLTWTRLSLNQQTMQVTIVQPQYMTNTQLEVWYTTANAILSSQTFTVTLSQSVGSAIFSCFATKNVDLSVTFDGSLSYANNNGVPSPMTAVQTHITTTNDNDILFGYFVGYTNPVLTYSLPSPFPTPIGGFWNTFPASGSINPGWVDASILVVGSNAGHWNQAVGLYHSVHTTETNFLVAYGGGPNGNTWQGVAGALAGYPEGPQTILTISSLAHLPASADTLLIAGWIGSASGVVDIIQDTGLGGISFSVNLSGSNSVWSFSARTSGGGVIVSGTTTVGGDITDGWHSYALSVRASTHTAQLLVDSVLHSTTFTWSSSNPVGYAVEPWQVGPVAGVGEFSSLWFEPGAAFFDLSVSANVHILFGTSNCFVNWGLSGQLITGSSPPVFLFGDKNTYPDNLGTGGSFTLSGGPLINVTPPVACP